MSKNLSKKKILEFEDNNLMQIMCGAYHSNLDVIEKLQELGLAAPSKFVTDSYANNSNENKKMDFILRNLK